MGFRYRLQPLARFYKLQHFDKQLSSSFQALKLLNSLYSSSTCNQFPSNGKPKSKSRAKYGLFALGFLGFSSSIYYIAKRKIVYAEANNISNEKLSGQLIENLPFYKISDVAKHSKVADRVWVTFKDGVYDITDFIDQHPGGKKILMAAGSSIEPFWLLYGVHNSPEVYHLLEEYRIGNLLKEESEKNLAKLESSDPYASDPSRHPALKPASVKPFNAEPPPSLLVDNFNTPNEIFYVRNHLPVPQVDETKYKLYITGLGVKEKSFTLEEIKKFPKYTVSATVQCAGNRRSEMVQVKPVKGLNWGHAAIGNATWSGPRLIDVLKSCGLKEDISEIEHVQFEGLDMGPDEKPYGASVPAEKVLDPRGDVILAYEMNGVELPRDHGYPLRVIVPGIVGARNVKWVGKIILSGVESDSHWQQNDYKGFSPSTDWDTVDFSKSPAIQELPIISAICSPEEGDTVEVDDGMLVVKGYAWSGGGRSVVRVDVSSDNGKSWHVADLEQTNDKVPRHWAWTLWSAAVPVSNKYDKIELWAKAVDSSYNTQPESFQHIWNLRGVLSNAYHKVKVNISNSQSQ